MAPTDEVAATSAPTDEVAATSTPEETTEAAPTSNDATTASTTTDEEPPPEPSATTDEPEAAPAPEPTQESTPTEEDREQDASAPEPTESAEPTSASEDACDPQTLSQDLLGEDTGIEVIECEQDWAYALAVEGEGDSDFIAERGTGTWTSVMTLGSPTCREELLEQGAPESVVEVVRSCEEAQAPGGGSEADCTIVTEQHGATNVVLDNIPCEEAAAIWESAGGEPSYEDPVEAADGWSCFVFPRDALEATAVAGSCDAPGYTASFVLYVAG